MSLSAEAHRASPLSSFARVAPLAAIAALAACGAGGQKAAYSPGAAYGPAAASSPGIAATAPVSPYGEGGHAAIDAEPAPDRPGLGTTWGERVTAPISFEPFHRAQPTPWAEVVLHYNDAAGVRAHAELLDARPRPLEVYTRDGALSVALVDEDGHTLPGFAAGNRTLVVGEDGARYRIVVRNQTPVRFEVVTSVDGLDVLDGRPADPNRRGYLVDAHGTLTIDGFRTSDDAVAAFRFGAVADSYAAQTSGDRNVGVVGLAIFAERGAEWDRRELGLRDSANAFPQRDYAAPPR